MGIVAVVHPVGIGASGWRARHGDMEQAVVTDVGGRGDWRRGRERGTRMRPEALVGRRRLAPLGQR